MTPDQFARPGRLGGLARCGAAALAILVVFGCGTSLPSPSPLPSSPAASPGPTPRPSPTPVPTPLVTPGPTPSEAATEDADLVIRVTGCADICTPTPGTTVLADRLIIWEGPTGRPLAAGLTRAGAEQIQVEIAALPELATNGEYQAQLRPGAEPFPRGTSIFQFKVGSPKPRTVVSGDPADYALEPDLWTIPPAMDRLAAFAKQLLDPVAWLGPDALAGPIRPYRPERYLVIVELFPGVGSMPEFPVDIDAVASPFDGPFENLGEPVLVDEGGFPVRCLVADAETARRLAAAEVAVGVGRDLEAWSSAVAYGWQRGQGFVQLTVRQVLPHQRQPCAELELT
jgi:hypothetical protein